jgi:hypothetical protein
MTRLRFEFDQNGDEMNSWIDELRMGMTRRTPAGAAAGLAGRLARPQELH